MKKLEPGMLCRVVGAIIEENNGKLVTLVKYVGVPPIEPMPGTYWRPRWWEIEETVISGSKISGARRSINYIKEEKIVPINPDHQPADEQWQADFKRMLNGEKLRAKP